MEEVEEFFVLFLFTYDLLNKKAEFRILQGPFPAHFAVHRCSFRSAGLASMLDRADLLVRLCSRVIASVRPDSCQFSYQRSTIQCLSRCA
jgi:hypothetical protein